MWRSRSEAAFNGRTIVQPVTGPSLLVPNRRGRHTYLSGAEPDTMDNANDTHGNPSPRRYARLKPTVVFNLNAMQRGSKLMRLVQQLRTESSRVKVRTHMPMPSYERNPRYLMSI